MSSGQKKEVINTNERAVSTDIDRLQDFIGQERNDILRSIMQRSYSQFDQPGVSVVPSGAVATPLQATVIDGLELIVDNPGSVLISAGALVAWTGPAAGADDTGFTAVIDPGVQAINQLQITTNSGGSPRCDVIECQVQSIIIEGNVSRDIRNPITGLFAPQNVTKVIGSSLVYRVRQGTAGVAPGYAAGWLPLGLAVVQPGATLSQVDFYDVRPLYREWDNTAGDWNAEAVAADVPVHGSGNLITCGAGLIADAVFDGWVDAAHNGVKFRGTVRRTAPIATLANFGSITAGTGGDGLTVTATADNCLRGAAMAAVAGDSLLLAAFIPDLGGSRPLPRCVRYSESSRTVPTVPGRRTPIGPNGILLVATLSQDPPGTGGLMNSTSLNATSIKGCLGGGHGVLVAVADISQTITVLDTTTGIGIGMRTDAGLPAPQNRLIQEFQLSHTGGVGGSTTSTTPVDVPNAAISILCRENDILDISLGPLRLLKLVAVSGNYILQITEDFGNTNVSAATKTFPVFDTNNHIITWPYRHVVGPAAGVVQVKLQFDSDGTNNNAVGSNGMDEWGTIKHFRP